MAHRINKTMFFRCLKSFECLMLLVCACFGQTAWHYNLCAAFGSAGLFDYEWQILELLRDVVVILPANIMMGTLDGLFLRRRYRLLMQCIFIMNLALRWFQHRFQEDSFWIQSDVQLWLWHGSPRTIYLACLCQALVFLAKGFVAYLFGYPFAHITAQFRLAPGGNVKDEPKDLSQNSGISERSAPSVSAQSRPQTTASEIDLEKQNTSMGLVQMLEMEDVNKTVVHSTPTVSHESAVQEKCSRDIIKL